MKLVGVILLSLIAAILVSGLPGSGSLVGRSIATYLIGYLIFFHSRRFSPTIILVTITAYFELTGTMHFGSYSLIALLTWFIMSVFSEQIRFTSPYVRYVVAATLVMALLGLVGYPLAGYTERLLLLSLTLIPVIGLTLAFNLIREPSRYELI